MLDSFLYWIGLCRPFLSSINRMKSITDLTIEREELRIDADYEEVSYELYFFVNGVTSSEKLLSRKNSCEFVPPNPEILGHSSSI